MRDRCVLMVVVLRVIACCGCGRRVLALLLVSLALAVPAAAQPTAPAPPLAETLRRLEELTRRLEAAPATPAPAPQEPGVPFLLTFTGSVRGLEVGAPVEVRGVPIGTVRELAVTYDPARNDFAVPVTVSLQPSLVPGGGLAGASADQVQAIVADLVGRGLRARLASAGLLGGPTLIELVILAEAPPAGPRGDGRLPEIPTVPSEAEAMRARLELFLARLAEVDVEAIAQEIRLTVAAGRELIASPELRQGVRDLAAAAAELDRFAGMLDARLEPVLAGVQGTVGDAHAVLTGPELKATLADLEATARSLRAFAADLDRYARPLVDTARGSLAEVGRTAEDARRTLATVERLVDGRSPIMTELQSLLREANATTRAMRQLLEQIERQPNSLLFGKSEER